MLDRNTTQASDTGSYIDTAGYLNDVKLAETLLENGKKTEGNSVTRISCSASGTS